jgi:hypothetical protein
VSDPVARLNDSTSPAQPFSWTDSLLPFFPGAPVALLEQTVGRVIYDVFRRSLIWSGVSPWVAGDGTTRRFAVPPPEPDSVVIHVWDGITDDGLVLRPAPVVASPMPLRRPDAAHWYYFTSPQQGMVEFDAPPPAGAKMRFTVAMAPLGLNMPPNILREVQNAVVLGVRANMHMMALKPWFDRVTGRDLAGMYEREVLSLKVRGRLGRTTPTVQMPIYNAAGGSRWRW